VVKGKTLKYFIERSKINIMQKVRLGINGFGRIGRLILRCCTKRDDVEVAVISARSFTDMEYMTYIFKYDTVHGRFDGKVEPYEEGIIVNGKKIVVVNETDPLKIDWGKYGVDVVMEATGAYTTKEKCKPHLAAGAKKVLITAASADAPMFIMGVNHHNYEPSMNVVSNASCTTNCLTPLAKVIHDEFTIESGLMTTVHAVTATQKTVDGSSKKDWRDGRAALGNIIPSTTGAAKAVGKIIPELNGKLTGMSLRVPVLDVSVVDLTVNLKRSTSYAEIKEVVKKAANTHMKGIIEYSDALLVSSDIIGNLHSCVFDSRAGIALTDKFFKLLAWYDNEMGYASKTVDLAVHITRQSEN
jgi:glyceraldehyde 3-phosphate dehydrogenase